RRGGGGGRPAGGPRGAGARGNRRALAGQYAQCFMKVAERDGARRGNAVADGAPRTAHRIREKRVALSAPPG
ncbi:hypothetical protein AB0I68_29945, partial [Streptomyces sp. NPDC050448]|uniref:hypothetical protein n=1 Tax=Streptomyces sp. NPDC050448 TaxID=3155404 RepID=UPI0034496E93